MTEQPIHPMQPSAEQFGEWLAEACRQWLGGQRKVIAGIVARLAYAAGADEELEECIAWFDRHIPGYEMVADKLRAARRPKPPSLKQQALKLVTDYRVPFYRYSAEQTETIRRALELIPDD